MNIYAKIVCGVIIAAVLFTVVYSLVGAPIVCAISTAGNVDESNPYWSDGHELLKDISCRLSGLVYGNYIR